MSKDATILAYKGPKIEHKNQHLSHLSQDIFPCLGFSWQSIAPLQRWAYPATTCGELEPLESQGMVDLQEVPAHLDFECTRLCRNHVPIVAPFLDPR